MVYHLFFLVQLCHGQRLQDVGVALKNSKKLYYLDCSDDLVCLLESTERPQLATDGVARVVGRFGTYFAPSKCNAKLQDWTTAILKLKLDGEELATMDSMSYLRSLLTRFGSKAVQASTCMSKVREAYAGLRHLSYRTDTSLKLEYFEYCGIVHSVLPYCCKTWSSHTKNVRRMKVFDHLYLRNISGIEWSDPVSNVRVGNLVLGPGSNNNISACET